MLVGAMTFINRMIKAAKAEPQPRELTIRPNQVRALAEHCLSCTAAFGLGMQLPEIEQHIRNGGLRMLNVPIRVLGR
jgi:hypothetical protein